MRPSIRHTLCGILNLNKPGGITSRDAVNVVARSWRGTKVGHAGTLDPLASGVLIVCVGRATRLIEYVQRMPKTYLTTIRLDLTSDTLDIDGRVTPIEHSSPPEAAQVAEALEAQVGDVEQMPPQFSALKVRGERAYELARAGRQAELVARRVVVHRIDMLEYEWPRVEAEVECGSGTYIRSIARDVGMRLGCGGIVERLVRTRIGHFVSKDSVSLEQVSHKALPSLLRPATEAVAALPSFRLNPDETRALAQGQPISVQEAPSPWSASGEVALLDENGTLVGIAAYESTSGRLLPRRVLVDGSQPDSCKSGPDSASDPGEVES